MSYRYIIAFSIVLGLFIVLDSYLWFAFKSTTKKQWYQYTKWLIPFSTLLFLTGFLLILYRGNQHLFNASYTLNVFFGLSIGIFVVKLILTAIFLSEDLVRIVKWILSFFQKKEKKLRFSDRRNFIKNSALGIAALPFLGSLYAVTKGKYNFQVKKISLYFNRLPLAFNDFKVVQFTDFHAGTFDDFEQVKHGLSLINEQKPDIIVFTGDMVNNRAKEVLPYLDLLKNLSAKHGKFAILGNHDYGDYIPFESTEERNKNLQQLEDFYTQAGFQLLKNESIQIHKGEEKIDLIAVENWGQGAFPKYGDIDLASQNTSQETFNIVLSHDPDHWEYILRKHPKFYDLTLSGHTHGSQVGIEIPGWKWSPVKYRYKRWLGYYQENERQLFVSKGFGSLGFPGRLGMWPEIVVFKLKNKTSV